MPTLLQIVQDQSLVEDPADNSLTIAEILMKGGWIMIPILILSLLTFYIFIERLLTIKKASINPDRLFNEVKEKVKSGDIEAARMLCAGNKAPIAKMLEKGLARIGSPLKSIETSIENVGKLEIYRLEKNLTTMATIAGAAPMIGFLGTVTGMIQAFIVIANEKTPDTSDLAGGIYEAMITTAAGLAVGIIAYIGYNYLVAQVQKAIHRMEYATIEFLELLQESD